MGDELTKDQIIAMAAACIAEDLGTEIRNLRISGFSEVHKTGLAKYIYENNINYVKYQLGD